MLEHIVGSCTVQGLGGHLVVVATEVVLLQVGPVAFGVGPGGDHHLVGADRALGGCHLPTTAFTGQLGNAGVFEQMPAQAPYRSGQATGVAHGVDGAGAAVEQRSGNLVGTAVFLALGAGQQLYVSATAAPLFMACFKVGDASGVVRHVQRAFVLGLAVDAEAFDHGEHFSRGFAKHLVQAAALLLAEGGLDVVGADPGAGVDQADVAPGATVADLPGLQHDHRLALFEQVDGRRQAGNTAADHTDIGLVLTGQGLGGDGRFADVFPQALLTQFGHGRLQQFVLVGAAGRPFRG